MFVKPSLHCDININISIRPSTILETWLVSFSSEFLFGGNCACVCHFSYAYATSVNFGMLMLMSRLSLERGFESKAPIFFC